MPNKTVPDAQFVEMFNTHGATKVGKILKISERSVYARRRRLERFHPMAAPSKRTKEYPHRAIVDIKNGSVLIGSDFHIWPGAESVALRAFKKFAKDLKPAAVILNGDVLDFPQISRHPPIGWESAPSLKAEIEAAQDHLDDIAKACGRARKIWTLGNHDARFETRLATVAREYKGLRGIHLSDFFGVWEKGWSTWINETVVCKHRWKGGVGATRANALNSGKTMVTGHLHSQKVTPFTDYNGTRYGIDTGCVASPDHKAFVGYTEDASLDWVSGFAVLKFRDGRLMDPQLVKVWDDNHVEFLGNVIKV